jgi:hypothetical protein
LIHVFGPSRGIECGKDEAKPADMLGTHFAAVVIFKKELQALVPKALDHRHYVKRQLTFVKLAR